LVESESEDEGSNKMTVKSIIEDSDARRRGLDTGDELVSFAAGTSAPLINTRMCWDSIPRGGGADGNIGMRTINGRCWFG